jgi:HEAT repeat protein
MVRADYATDLQSADLAVRQAAAEKLSQLGEGASAAAIAMVKAVADADETVRTLCGAALEECGAPPAESVEELEALLKSEHADVGYWAATLLGRLEDSSIAAVESLREAAASHPSQEVRKRATWALGKIASG